MAVPPLIEVVEDDVDVRRTLVRVIESFGYRVRCHENALAYLAAEPMEDAAAMVAEAFGLPKRDVYQLALKRVE